MDTRPIGVFDSGLGGLTAVRQLRRLLPGETLWDVAKQYRTDETLLRTVNQLEGEELPDKMLLIPRVR